MGTVVAAGKRGVSTTAACTRQLHVIVIGLPGSGKSTMIRSLLDRRPQTGHFGVRLHFKRQVELGTDIGLRAAHYVQNGLWIPDELLIEAIRAEFESGRFVHGFVIEGVPGNARQAALLDELLDERRIDSPVLVYVEASDELCLERALRRRVCTTCDGGVEPAVVDPDDETRCARCGSTLGRRWDDDEEPFRRRLALHRNVIGDILPYYDSARTLVADGSRSREELLRTVVERLAHPGCGT